MNVYISVYTSEGFFFYIFTSIFFKVSAVKMSYLLHKKKKSHVYKKNTLEFQTQYEAMIHSSDTKLNLVEM